MMYIIQESRINETREQTQDLWVGFRVLGQEQGSKTHKISVKGAVKYE